MSNQSSSSRAAGSSTLAKLNVASLLLQAGNALRRGNTRQAALLLGAATIAPRYRVASYLIQGGVGLNNLRKKLTASGRN